MKAQIAAKLDDYPWSSYKGYLSVSKKWDWIYKEFIFSILSDNKKEWIQRYREFMAIADDEEVSDVIEGKKWPVMMGGKEFMDYIKGQYYALKDDEEVTQAKDLAPEPEQIINTICDFYGVTPDNLFKAKRGEFNEPRNVSIYLMRKLRRETLKNIGARFGMEKYSSVSSVIERLKITMQKDRKIRDHVDKLCRMFNKNQEQTPL